MARLVVHAHGFIALARWQGLSHLCFRAHTRTDTQFPPHIAHLPCRTDLPFNPAQQAAGGAALPSPMGTSPVVSSILASSPSSRAMTARDRAGSGGRGLAAGGAAGAPLAYGIGGRAACGPFIERGLAVSE